MNKLFEKLANKWIEFKTKKHTQIPLLYIVFNYKKFLEYGEKGSCNIHFHPDLKDDKELQNMLFNIVDYIRDNYDMERFTKI